MAGGRDDGRLAVALAAHRPGSRTAHVVVGLPSVSMGESLLAHYATRLPSLEHRYLLAVPLLARLPHCEIVVVCSLAPTALQLEDQLGLVPAALRADCRARLHVVSLDDATPRSLSAKLLDREDLLSRIRGIVAGRPAFVEPWNVTEHEARVSAALDVPLYGTEPGLRHLGFKSEGRRVLRAAGVPVPEGVEDVRTAEDVTTAVETVLARVPGCPGVVVKLDDSASGDGNRVLRPGSAPGVARAVRDLPAWYLDELGRGGVVEELVDGPRRSPSVQVDIPPVGPPVVVSTHDQVLGGADGQVYQGCRFPASRRYARDLARIGCAVGLELARRGALGRVGVDLVTASRERSGRGMPAVEINLRGGGTTYPLMALRSLVPGHYDADAGQWVATSGGPRYYEASDNLVDPSWLGRDPAEVVAAVRRAGLRFDRGSGTGVVLHMLSCLAVDGRVGVLAVGRSRAHAAELYAETAAVLGR